MSIRPKDPLLLAGKVMALLMQAAMAIGALALLIAIPVVTFYHEDVIDAFAREVNDPAASLPIGALIGIMLIGLAVVGLLFFFFDRLRRIIATVGEGDPFQPGNANRLSQMGWLILSVQLLAVPANWLIMPIARAADEAQTVHFATGGKVDFGLLLLTIVLFILARVFRHGAAMRDDLEGTV
ncbi:DUF2975 domain-containing protein [Altererythrobacter aerius]|uniref:DUF2975 domain-containing protein n=1 Tax=Tsuneonella aeria TaxID=1837929 RepID=A0A6I4TDX6_9SPHN|nr:DUF2975 domain-containing protein [Tsuneonella aeria]MXO75263.1 DUF2975 domain-containing protein [Tsuneonella aeria]